MSSSIRNNKHTKFKLSPLKVVSIILVSSLMAWFVFYASAATASISLLPSKTNVNKGETFTLGIRIESDVKLNSVLAKVKFDPQKVKYKNIDFNGTSFTSDLMSPEIGSDYIFFMRLQLQDPKPVGNIFVANLEFEAISDSGMANFTFYNGENELGLGNDAEGTVLVPSFKVTQVKLTSPIPPALPPQPPQPPVSNPAGPTHTVTPPPSTPSTPAAPSTSRPTTPTAPTPSASPSSNPITNYFRPATNPTSTQFKAGDSKLSKQPSLMQKILIWVKLLAPIVVVGTIIIGIVWFVIKKASMHAFGFGEAVTGLPHVGPVKTPISNTPANNSINQPVGPIKPSPSSGTNVKPSSYTDPNDHTPRTFSGV